MKQLLNRTTRSISYEEHKAILEACHVLELAFKKKVFSLTINPVEGNPSDVYGLMLSFDLEEQGYR